DNTWQILEQYQQNNNNVFIYKNEKNLGYVKNFEEGLKKTKGELIAMSDQDDIWLPEKLELQEKNIDDAILIYHDSALVDKNGEYLHKNISSVINMYEGDNCLALIFDNCVSGHTILMKRELLNFIFPFSKDTFHDGWIAFVALAIGKIKYLPNLLVQYRQHEKSITDISTIKENKNQNRKTKRQLHSINQKKEYQHIMMRLEQYNTFQNFKEQKNKKLIQNLINAFEKKKKTYFVPQLFLLLFKNRKYIFFTRKKSKFKIFKTILRMVFFFKYN
ncbi:MAG: glycosyltransferase, partial [Cytophagales bacterium]